MSFPSSPINGQTAVVNGINYTYSSTTNSWTRLTGSVSSINSISITSTVSSTSTTTGALQVAGGTGIVGNLNVGGNIVVSSNINATGASGPQMRFEWDTWRINGNTAIAAMSPAGTLTGSSTWDSNVAYGIDLTTSTTSQVGSVYWNSSTVNYNNNMTISGSFGAFSGSGADGYGIFFGSNSNITSSTYSTSYGVFVFCHYYNGSNRWEVYVNGTQTNYPFVQAASYAPSGITVWNSSTPIFNDISIKINYFSGKRLMEVYLNGSHQFTQDITSWSPLGNYFGVNAYTGGSTAYNLVRSLRVWW